MCAERTTDVNRPSVSRNSVVRTDQHVLAGTDVILDARQTAAVRAAPIRRMSLTGLTAFPLPSIEENPDFLTLPELPSEGLP